MPNKKIRTCRVCGCTDQSACFNEDMGFCWWVEKDLCSHCDPETVAIESGVAYDIANSLTSPPAPLLIKERRVNTGVNA